MKQSLIFLISTIISATIAAQDISSENNIILEKIKHENEKYTTIISDFEQTRFVQLINKTITSSGKFNYNKPHQLLMSYDHPSGDIMLINGDKCLININGKKNETSAKTNSKAKALRNILSACLSGNIHQIRTTKVTCETNSKYYIVNATIDQKHNKTNIVSITLSYDINDLSLATMQTIEADGSNTTYKLIDKKFNQTIDANIFVTNNH
jgi:outer membrane lipoprotein-sorting protein